METQTRQQNTQESADTGVYNLITVMGLNPTDPESLAELERTYRKQIRPELFTRIQNRLRGLLQVDQSRFYSSMHPAA
jgi:hypothetical protein